MGNSFGWARWLRLGWAFVPVLALVLLGCGGKPTGDVSGKVVYQKKPVVSGSVVIVGSDNKPRTGEIKPDGTYTVLAVPVGEAKIAVISPDPNPDLPPPQEVKGKKKPLRPEGTPVEAEKKKKDVADKWFPLPEKYADVDRSGLTVTIQEGPNDFPVTLK